FKDSERLPASGSVLHLPAVTVEDSGNYSCALKTDEAVRSETLSVSVEGVLSDRRKWGVNYTGSICAVRGLNVTISCSYFYPKSFKVQKFLWCSINSTDKLCLYPPYVYDSSSPKPSDIFQYAGDKESNCTLLIRNVQFSHSAEYKFRFITNKMTGKWTGDPGVTLEVGDLPVISQSGNGTLKEGDSVNLTCAVNCSHSSPQFVWFKDSERLPASGSVLHFPALTVNDSGSYSCALKTDEAVRSKTLSINIEGFNWLVLCLVISVILFIALLIILAVIYKRRKEVKAQEESAGGSGQKTQVGERAQSGLQQDGDVTYASVRIKPNKLKKSPVSTVHLEEDDSVIYSAVAGK
ncbi:uncharacterized protein, partial [Salminus brasiliensis]|uniref:uncharacterized protein n=1 Tax=Salminus brasiliensis TaxID=930266 RepID=UPI003B82E150